MAIPKTVLIEGYYFVGDAVKDKAKEKHEYPDLSRTLVSDKLFKFSARRFKLADLHVLPLQRLYGSFVNSKEVQGVIDTTGSLIPFFIDRQKVKKLQELILTSRDSTDVHL
mgnify:CR=1 FL=1|jgi:hypothetical protein